MEEVEVRRLAAEKARVIGKPRRIVIGGVARDRACRFHGALDRLRRKVGGARVAAALAEIDRDAEALVAVVLDGLDLAAAHRHRLAYRGRDFDLGIARAEARGGIEREARDIRHRVTRKRQRCGRHGMVWHRDPGTKRAETL